MGSSDYVNLGKATHCSLGFLILFIASNSMQNIQTTLLEDNDFGHLGDYSNAMISFALMVGCLTSTSVNKKLGDMKAMGVGSLLCVPWIASFLIPAIEGEYYKGSDSFVF